MKPYYLKVEDSKGFAVYKVPPDRYKSSTWNDRDNPMKRYLHTGKLVYNNNKSFWPKTMLVYTDKDGILIKGHSLKKNKCRRPTEKELFLWGIG
jgi:hypothetical protein